MTANVTAMIAHTPAGQAVDAVGEVDHVHHRHQPDDREQWTGAPALGKASAPTNGSVMALTATPTWTTITAASDLSDELDAGVAARSGRRARRRG